MWSRRRALLQLLRALIACAVLVFAAELPAFQHNFPQSAGLERDPSGWVAPRRALASPGERAAPAARAVRRRAAPSAPEARARAAVPSSAVPVAALRRLDARYLYLELQSLLC